jgi:uncharacterized protein involved in outer membrane biogenesis
MKSKKGFKILIGIVVGIILLIIAATVVVKLVFTKEKLMAMLVPRIETALKRKVEIQDVSVSIWRGLGVDVNGMKVLNPPGFNQPTLLQFDQLQVRVKFLPLLHKRIEISKLILKDPVINLEKTPAGVSNYADLTESKGGKIILPIAFDQMEIKNGEIHYQDSQGGKEIYLHHLDQSARLSLDEKMENASVVGKITVPQIELSLPDYKGKLPPLTLSIEHDVNLNMPGDWLDVKSIKIGIAKIEMEVKGKIENISTVPVLNLVVESNEIPMSDLIASLPQTEASLVSKLKLSGDMKITALFKGATKGEQPLQARGKIELNNVKVDFSGVPESFNMPYGEVNFTNQSLNFYTSQAKLGQAPVELKVVVDNFSDPNLTAELKAKLNLAMVSEIVQMPEKTSLAGNADINVKASGKIKKAVKTMGPEGMNVSGQLQLSNVEATTPTLGVPVSNLNATFSFQKGNVDIPNLSLSLGKSSLTLQGKVNGGIQYFLFKQGEKPLLEFSMNSPLLDLDEILPPSPETKPGEKTASADTILPLPNIDVDGQISIQKTIFRQVELTDLSAKVEVKDGVLHLDNVASKVYSGSVGGKVTCDLNDIEQIPYNIDVTVNQIEANDFLSRFTGFDNHLYGKLNMTADFSGKGNELTDLQKTLIAKGKVTFTDGKLVNWDILNKIASFLKMDSFKEQQIKTLWNVFRIENSRVWFDDFSAVTQDGDYKLTGSVGLDGSLDYKLNAVLSPVLSTKFDALGSFSNYLKNDQGRVVLDIKIKGPVTNPEFYLDTSQPQEKLKQDVKEKTQEQLKEKGQDLLDQLLKKTKK